jgi:hypothetical protein
MVALLMDFLEVILDPECSDITMDLSFDGPTWRA